MQNKRIHRLNSLLKKVISEVISKDVKDPHLSEFITVTNVDITPDMRNATVLISIISSNDLEKEKTIKILNQATGFISIQASKKVVMRYFPTLLFKLDSSIDKQMKIEKILADIKKNKNL